MSSMLLICMGLVMSALAEQEPQYDWQPTLRSTSPRTSEHLISETEPFNFRIALKQNNLDVIRNILDAVSDPRTHVYGKYLTSAAVTALVKLEEEEIKSVLDWVTQPAIQACTISAQLTVNKDYIEVETCVGRARELFGDIVFQEYVHPVFSWKKAIRTQHLKEVHLSKEVLSVPQRLHHLIDLIQGVVDLPMISSKAFKRLQPEMVDEPGKSINPLLLRILYDIENKFFNSSGSGEQEGQAVAEFEEGYFYPSDIKAFQAQYQLKDNPVKKIVGTNDPDEGYLGEATLDVEYITTVSNLVETWVFSQLDFDLTKWAINVSSTSSAPLVHSISWGSPERRYSVANMQRDNNEFMKMGVQGFTILTASGDDGTGNSGWLFCKNFNPQFPSTSPYVTAVGGTYLDDDNIEVAWSHSGSGFSNVFSRPSYQEDAVKEYLSKADLPDQKHFNSSSRAIPDISALSTNYEVLIENFPGQLSGTSAASPTFAALFTMINLERKQKNLPPLGFLNPRLYQLKKVGYDVVDGEAIGHSCKHGFKAAEGWDPATGLGTPIYTKWLKEQLISDQNVEKSSEPDILSYQRFMQ